MSEVVRKSLKTAVKGTTMVFVGNVLSVGVWFVTKVLIVRNVTKEELGLYSLAVAVVSIASLISTAGLQDGTTRQVAVLLGEGREDRAQDAGRSAVRLALWLGLLCSALIYVTAEPLARHVFYLPEFAPVLKAMSLFGVFFVHARILMGVVRGFGYIQPWTYFITIGNPVFFLLMLGAVFGLHLPFIGVIYAYVGAMALAWAGVALYGWFRARVMPLVIWGGSQAWEVFRFSLPLVATAVMGMIYNWTDTLMLGRYADAEVVGTYNISISLVRLLTFISGSASFVFMPIAGEMFSRGQMDELKRTFQVLTKWVFAGTLPIFFVLFLFPEMTITFLFGERFIGAAFPLQVLCAGVLFHVFVGVNSVILLVMGRSKTIMNVSLIGTVANILLNYLLIKRFGMGMTGAAVATTLSFAISSVLYFIVLYRLSRLHPFTIRYIRPLFGAMSTALLIYVLAKSLPLYMWMMPLYLALFVVGYAGTILFTRSVEVEDIELVEAVARRTGIPVGSVVGLMRSFLHR
jgi:O-antigen/teichoic acid export membrane protein